ncbi:MAG: VOC family protein [Dehalococcoidia bacterium]|jgi:catechol 2,3-dioxygenase-like lactoylglutathione lyase family enzyme|nr:VOC family protein [Dehalococcoidia bacterium]MDP7239630.1 VOC family protein [Dehalococcoidia bacterium]MDP7469619.1 VOC family protein [Dehalococcoidia bacterium]
MAQKPPVAVKEVLQVCVVVKDVEQTTENYQRVVGIGPWKVFTVGPPTLSGTLRGKPEAYSMKIALARVGDIAWELIEPLEGPSIYREFLEQKGEGLHHIKFAVDDHDKSVAEFAGHGIGVLMGGAMESRGYSYMDTESVLGFILETTYLK